MATRIVFVHGVGGSADVWRSQLERFPGSVAITLPGHPTGRGRNRIDDYVDDLHSWIGEQGVGPGYMLVGHSMGGAVAQAYARRYPNEVRLLGLFATGARLRVAPELLDGVLADFAGFAHRMVEWALAPDAPESLKRAYLDSTLQVSPATIRGDWEACDGFDSLTQVSEIRQPTLIVVGEQDRLTPVKYAEYFHRHLPNSRLVVIPRVGHFVQWEAPEVVDDALAAFLRDNEKNHARDTKDMKDPQRG
ncbi:MAG TPA: alpha/beta hydrolase [Dehalococcoidia bacterium]|nr:alpha/beta hydrolase [Dehalococcoidia bacterium]